MPLPSTAWLPQRIENSADLTRIRALPIYDWKADPDLPAVTEALTDALVTPAGRAEGRKLRPIQAASLATIYNHGGLMAPQLPGAGKTLTTFLAGRVYEWRIGRAPRVLLIVPASLHKKPYETSSKTIREYRKEAQWWHVSPIVTYTYETLSRKRGAQLIAQVSPDLIVLDEAQYITDTSVAVWKKLRWYMDHRVDPVGFVCLSANLMDRGPDEIYHLNKVTLAGGSPTPLDLRTAKSWQLALGTKVHESQRLDPTPLIALWPEVKGETSLDQALYAFGQRFTNTIGVVASVGDRPPYGLEIEVRRHEAPATVAEFVDHMKAHKETPDGYALEHDIEIYAREVQIEQGWHYVWDPPAPAPYKLARRSYVRLVRDIIDQGHEGLDTPEQVKLAIWAGRIGPEAMKLWEAWQEQDRAFTPNPVPIWVDDTAMSLAIDWLDREAHKTGIVWVDFPHVGLALESLTGLPYFRTGGWTTDQKQHIEKCKTSCIASIRSCSTGINIHHWYDRSYHLGWEPVGGRCEQTLGRTHRDGQRADTTYAVIPVMTAGKERALRSSILDAEKTTLRTNVPQKLAYATWLGLDP